MHRSIKRERGLFEKRQNIKKVLLGTDDEIQTSGLLQSLLEVLLVLGLSSAVSLELQPDEQPVDNGYNIRRSVGCESAALHICEEYFPFLQDISSVPLDFCLFH